MIEEMIKKLGDQELRELVIRGQQEVAIRARKQKEETIARIKALASAEGISIAIKGTRGRPPREGQSKLVRAARGK